VSRIGHFVLGRGNRLHNGHILRLGTNPQGPAFGDRSAAPGTADLKGSGKGCQLDIIHATSQTQPRANLKRGEGDIKKSFGEKPGCQGQKGSCWQIIGSVTEKKEGDKTLSRTRKEGPK